MRKSFTLIELLIVIAIVAVLAVVVILTLNPAQLLKQARDANRVSDMDTLNRALAIYQVDQVTSTAGATSSVYVSIADPSLAANATSTCASLGLPAIPAGYSYYCVSSSSLRNVDGTGWIPVNFKSISSGSPLGQLPVDPVNTVASGAYYTYMTGGSWALSAGIESDKYARQTLAQDSGTHAGRFVSGTNTNLYSAVNAASAYWSFDEGSGTTIADASGNANTGVFIGAPSWGAGKAGKALTFNGTTDGISVTSTASLSPTGSYTLSAWLNPASCPTGGANAPFIEKPLGGDARGAFRLDLQTGCKTDAGIGTGAINGNQTIPTGSWSMVTGVFNAPSSTLSLYVNGGFDASGGAGVPGVSTSSITFARGYWSSWGVSYAGSMDEVRFYNRALSTAEVMALYTATK